MLTAVQVIMEKFVSGRFYRVGKVSAKELQYCRNYNAKVWCSVNIPDFKTELHFVENPDLCFNLVIASC